jgi:sec-independent protein translocase protein TatA
MFANIGPWQLLIILVIVLAIFGTKRLRTLGSDLGSAVKGFRSAMNEAEEPSEKLGDSSGDADFDNTPAEESRKEKDA